MSGIYRKGEVLGWGSCTVVYRGWDELLDRPVAIKELIQPFAACAPFSRAFRSRALKMLDVSSRYLLSTHSVDVDRSVQAVVRELADETVGQRCFQGTLDPEAIPKLLRQTLAGLDAIHSRGLVHGAVKPENIFVFGDNYKVGDFGLPTSEGFPPFPPSRLRYSSPEEIHEPDQINPASDIYSLGFTIYELILGPLRLAQVVEELAGEGDVGAVPRRCETDNVWPRFHGSMIDLPPIHVLEPGVPAALSLTLQKMVTKDLSIRFVSCKKVLASLGSTSGTELPTGSQKFSIAVNLPALATATPTPSSAPSQAGWAWAGGGALTVAALVAGGFLLFKDRDSIVHIPQPAVQGEIGSVTPQPYTGPASELAKRLLKLGSSEGGVSITLDPPRGPGRPWLAKGTPVRFRVESNQEGRLLLFALSPDGSITCLYPNVDRAVVAVKAGRSLILPSDEDPRIGRGKLEAQEPFGLETVFAVVSTQDLPPLPPGTGEPLREYAAGEPARLFADWLERLLKERSRETRLATMDFEIGAAR